MKTSTIKELIEILEGRYNFECEGGPLENCSEWRELKKLLIETEDHI